LLDDAALISPSVIWRCGLNPKDCPDVPSQTAAIEWKVIPLSNGGGKNGAGTLRRFCRRKN